MKMRLSGMARLRGLILWMFIAIPSIALPSMLAYALGLRVNMTRSLPMGIYAVTNDAFSELIECCPEGNAAKESKNRGYRNNGSCSDGAEPLIKPVVAREGDVVEFSARGISVNEKLLKNTAPLPLDGAGRPLTHWKFGVYRVAPGNVWVASTYNYGSYDSRYFGPVRISSISNRLRPIWTLH
jgi:conjugative transfer signal peptidase TraF